MYCIYNVPRGILTSSSHIDNSAESKPVISEFICALRATADVLLMDTVSLLIICGVSSCVVMFDCVFVNDFQIILLSSIPYGFHEYEGVSDENVNDKRTNINKSSADMALKLLAFVRIYTGTPITGN